MAITSHAILMYALSYVQGPGDAISVPQCHHLEIRPSVHWSSWDQAVQRQDHHSLLIARQFACIVFHSLAAHTHTFAAQSHPRFILASYKSNWSPHSSFTLLAFWVAWNLRNNGFLLPFYHVLACIGLNHITARYR